MCAAEMQKTSFAQGQRGVREVVRTVPDPTGEVLQAPQGRAGGPRRLPQVRVSLAFGQPSGDVDRRCDILRQF